MTTTQPKTGRWFEAAADPMDRTLLARRDAQVAAARRPAVFCREDFLADAARGRKVLDIGVVDHTSESDRQSNWLHGKIAAAAGECLGVDILEEELEKLRARGYNVLQRDVTTEPLDEQFEVIICGEVVEHLDSPGGLFKGARAMLAPDGRFLLSTPNPYAVWRAWQGVQGKIHDNVDHIAYFSPWMMIEQAERAGLELLTFRGVAYGGPGLKTKVMTSRLAQRVFGLAPESASETLVYEFGVRR